MNIDILHKYVAQNGIEGPQRTYVKVFIVRNIFFC